MRKILPCLFLLFVWSCVHAGVAKHFPAYDLYDCPKVYIFRQAKFIGDLLPAIIRLDGKEIGYLGPETYFSFCVSPGNHLIESAPVSYNVWFEEEGNFEASKSYFYKITLASMTLAAVQFKLVRITEETAQEFLKEMKNLRGIPLNK